MTEVYNYRLIICLLRYVFALIYTALFARMYEVI